MNFRTVSKIALASGPLMAAVFACSAPDPGQVVFVPRTDNATGGTGNNNNNNNNSVDGGSSGGGTDGGSSGGGEGGAGGDGGGGPITAFSSEPTYAAGTAVSTAKGQAGHGGATPPKTSGGVAIPNSDPSGMNCTDSACHGAGGAGSQWTFAGTAYIAAGMPAPAGVEVRVTDATGKEVDHVYTDANGNFYSQSQNTLGANALAGCRNSSAKANLMQSKTVAAGCNATGCHAAGANPMMAP